MRIASGRSLQALTTMCQSPLIRIASSPRSLHLFGRKSLRELHGTLRHKSSPAIGLTSFCWWHLGGAARLVGSETLVAVTQQFHASPSACRSQSCHRRGG